MENLLFWINESFIYIAACVLLLGVLIFVHELGHFSVARWCGVRVETFSMGFGKKIFKIQRGYTTYCLSIIPLGGYVKMFGDQPGEAIDDADKKYSFTHQPVKNRIAIVLAGPLMNFFFAWMIFVFLGFHGMDLPSAVIGDVAAGTEAAKAGFQPEDQIISVGEQEIRSVRDLDSALKDFQGRTAAFQVLRKGQLVTLNPFVRTMPNPNPVSTSSTMGDVDGLETSAKSSIIGVKNSSLIASLGVKDGDRIEKINGTPVNTWSELNQALKNISSKEVLSLDVKRENPKEEKFSVQLNSGWKKENLGIEKPDLTLYKVLPGSPAEKAGLQAGDRLTKLQNKTILEWEDILNAIKNYSGSGNVQIEFYRDGKIQKTVVEPQVTKQMSPFGMEEKRYTIGIVPSIIYEPMKITKVVARNVGDAFSSGLKQTWDYSVMTLLSFVRLFQNKISAKSVGGIFTIGQAAGDTFKMGLSKFLTMMAIISVNLFVLNLLPIPVLDGGHLVFYTIEVLKGSPLSLKKMEMAQQVGMLLLVGLMVFGLFNDVSRLFGKFH